MGRPLINLIGQNFGRLTVIEHSPREKGKTRWVCRCECGNIIITTATNLKSGNTRSCGCLQSELTSKRRKKHGMSNTPILNVWRNMNERCNNSNCESFKNYGGRGITVCDEWAGEHGAENFINWAKSHGYRDGLTIDRIENSKGYSPDNCRWVSQKVQNNNRRSNRYLTYSGETMTAKQLSEKANIPYPTFMRRLNNLHWSVEKAVETPIFENKRNKRYKMK